MQLKWSTLLNLICKCVLHVHMLIDNFIFWWFSISAFPMYFGYSQFCVRVACCTVVTDNSGRCFILVFDSLLFHIFSICSKITKISIMLPDSSVSLNLYCKKYTTAIFLKTFTNMMGGFLWETFISACVTMTFRGFVFGTILYISLQPISDYCTAGLCRFFLRYTYTALCRLLLYPGVTAGVLMY